MPASLLIGIVLRALSLSMSTSACVLKLYKAQIGLRSFKLAHLFLVRRHGSNQRRLWLINDLLWCLAPLNLALPSLAILFWEVTFKAFELDVFNRLSEHGGTFLGRKIESTIFNALSWVLPLLSKELVSSLEGLDFSSSLLSLERLLVILSNDVILTLSDDAVLLTKLLESIWLDRVDPAIRALSTSLLRRFEFQSLHDLNL